MDTQELAKRLKAAFLEELQEHVEAMNRHLLALEKDPPPEQRQAAIRELFRSAHTLKGAANANSFKPIENLCHCLEDILMAVRDGHRSFTDDLFALCFHAADALDEAGSRLREEVPLDDSPVAALLQLIERAAAGETVSLAKPSPAPPLLTPSENNAAEARPVAIIVPRSEQLEMTPSVGASVPVYATDSRAERATASVRVAADKLDKLLAQTGELLVARRRVESRLAELHELRDFAAEWSTTWRLVEKPLRLLVEPARFDRLSRNATAAPLPRRAAAVLLQTGDRIRQLERRFEQLAKVLRDDGRLLAQTCDALDEQVARVRMLPFSEACSGLERSARDVAHAGSKQVTLAIDGANVEVDRTVIEELKGPLMHMVRNAVDHGIETAAEREAAGKPAVATITIAAAIRGAMIEVLVSDDGRGFDTQRIREIAVQRGWSVPNDERDLVRLVFQAGFSTARTVTDFSGRGVGLDVVQARIEALHGTVDVDFTPGDGSRFTLQVPLTLTTTRAVLARVGKQTYIIPTNSVRKILRFDPARVTAVAGRPCLLADDMPIPIRFLSEFVRGLAAPRFSGGQQLGIELNSGGNRVVFVVDEILGEQDVVVKTLGHRIRRVRHVAGATLLPSGRVALLLNVANVLRSALAGTASTPGLPELKTETPRLRRLLIAEDSLTTRTLMKSILETAGFEVLTSADGQQAWEILAKETVDLVVSDVDMPRMSGFQLTELIRGSTKLAHLPVILVTARHSDEDKARGLAAGASAYVVKSAFDQRVLLEKIGQLL